MPARWKTFDQDTTQSDLLDLAINWQMLVVFIHTTSGRSDESPKNHQRRDELLSARRDIPSKLSFWCSVTKYLDFSVSPCACVRHELTSKKPGMACKPPMIPKSTPYWNGHIDTNVHANRHFQWDITPSFFWPSMVEFVVRCGMVVL